MNIEREKPMSLLDRNIKKYGEECKWLTCSFDCHMTECARNTWRIHTLEDRFRELGYKHPEVAYEYGKRHCILCDNGDYVAKGDFVDDYNEKFDITKKEEEAISLAVDEFSKMDLHALYVELKKKYVEKYVKEHEDKIAELKGMLDED